MGSTVLDDKLKHLSVRRKLSYATITVAFILLSLECACRITMVISPNLRWKHHAQLVQMIGFGQLNEILEPDRKLFWRLKPSVKAKTIRGTIGNSKELSFTVSTDEHGQRESVSKSNASNASIAFLGDSCTFGVGVNDDETFPALLEKKLPYARTRNCGVPGYTVYQGKTFFASYPHQPPSIVVVSFMFNDDSQWDQLSDLQHAEAQNTIASRLIRASRFASLLAQVSPSRAVESPKIVKRPRLTDEEYSIQLRDIVERCRTLRCQPIFLLWPLRLQMRGGALTGKQKTMKSLAEESGVPIVDLVSAFRNDRQELLFADVIHANADGHRIVASLLEPVIREQLKLPESGER